MTERCAETLLPYGCQLTALIFRFQYTCTHTHAHTHTHTHTLTQLPSRNGVKGQPTGHKLDLPADTAHMLVCDTSHTGQYVKWCIDYTMVVQPINNFLSRLHIAQCNHHSLIKSFVIVESHVNFDGVKHVILYCSILSCE